MPSIPEGELSFLTVPQFSSCVFLTGCTYGLRKHLVAHFVKQGRGAHERPRQLPGSKNSQRRKRHPVPDRETAQTPAGLPSRTDSPEGSCGRSLRPRGDQCFAEPALAFGPAGGADFRADRGRCGEERI